MKKIDNLNTIEIKDALISRDAKFTTTSIERTSISNADEITVQRATLVEIFRSVLIVEDKANALSIESGCVTLTKGAVLDSCFISEDVFGNKGTLRLQEGTLATNVHVKRGGIVIVEKGASLVGVDVEKGGELWVAPGAEVRDARLNTEDDDIAKEMIIFKIA